MHPATSTPVQKRGNPSTTWLAGAFFLTLVLSALAAAAVFKILGWPLTGIDDANIFFTYARNFVRGDGFVYYAGGERVEGYTSFAWLLICAACTWLAPPPELPLLCVSVILNAVTWTACLAFLKSAVERDVDGTTTGTVAFSGPALAFLAWVVINPGYILWTTVTLMDSGLWSTAFVCGTLAVSRLVGAEAEARQRLMWGACAWLALVTITRPESVFVVGALVAGFWLVDGSLKGDRIASLRTALIVGSVPTLSLGVLTLFRLWYFGYPFPNTFYAKVSSDLYYNLRAGYYYLRDFLRDAPPAFVCIGAALWAISSEVSAQMRRLAPTCDRVRVGRVAFVGYMCLMGLVPAVLTGGDHFKMYRHYQAVWPLMVLPLLAASGRLVGGKSRYRDEGRSRFDIGRIPLILGLLAGVAFSLRTNWFDLVFDRGRDRNSQVTDEFLIASSGRGFGEQLRRITCGGRRLSLGVITAGGIAYAYDGPVIDLMGLNNVAMGHSTGDRKGMKNHSAFDREVFFSLKPDVLLIDHDPDTWQREVFKNLLREPRFVEQYRWVMIAPAGSDGGSGDAKPLALWCRSDLVRELRDEFNVVESQSE